MAFTFTVTPLTGHTGAEIRGLDLTQEIDPETRSVLNHAFAQFHVLVVRGQKYTPEDFTRAVQVWGELQPHNKKKLHLPACPHINFVPTNQPFPRHPTTSVKTFPTAPPTHP